MSIMLTARLLRNGEYVVDLIDPHGIEKAYVQERIDRIVDKAMLLNHYDCIEIKHDSKDVIIIQCINGRLAIWRNNENPCDQWIVDSLDEACINADKSLVLIP